MSSNQKPFMNKNETSNADCLQRLVRRFDVWWHNEGSGMPPLLGEDTEEHLHRVCKIAWMNGGDSWNTNERLTEVLSNNAHLANQCRELAKENILLRGALAKSPNEKSSGTREQMT